MQMPGFLYALSWYSFLLLSCQSFTSQVVIDTATSPDPARGGPSPFCCFVPWLGVATWSSVPSVLMLHNNPRVPCHTSQGWEIVCCDLFIVQHNDSDLWSFICLSSPLSLWAGVFRSILNHDFYIYAYMFIHLWLCVCVVGFLNWGCHNNYLLGHSIFVCYCFLYHLKKCSAKVLIENE